MQRQGTHRGGLRSGECGELQGRGAIANHIPSLLVIIYRPVGPVVYQERPKDHRLRIGARANVEGEIFHSVVVAFACQVAGQAMSSRATGGAAAAALA